MSRSRAFANQERQAQSQRLGRFMRSALLLFATVLSFATVTLVVVDQLFRPDAFVIDQLKIKGSFAYLRPQQVEAIVLKNKLGNFFSIELDDIKRQIEELAWVRQADVRREWPDTLLVQVTEQRPVMRWNEDAWVNSAGEVITLPGDVSLDNPVQLSGIERDARLMLTQTLQWKRRLAARDVQLKGLKLSESHAYRLELSHQQSDFVLLLGREQVEQRLHRFEMLFEQQFRNSTQRLHRVDARYPDGLAIDASVADSTAADSIATANLDALQSSKLGDGSLANNDPILDSLTGNQ